MNKNYTDIIDELAAKRQQDVDAVRKAKRQAELAYSHSVYDSYGDIPKLLQDIAAKYSDILGVDVYSRDTCALLFPLKLYRKKPVKKYAKPPEYSIGHGNKSLEEPLVLWGYNLKSIWGTPEELIPGILSVVADMLVQ